MVGCWKIKDLFSSKKSGFYWVKPPCANSAMRVYCDFESEDEQYYAYLGAE